MEFLLLFLLAETPLSSTTKKETESVVIPQNNNFIRLVIYSIVGAMAILVGSLYAYKYFNPPPPETEEEVASTNKSVDDPDQLVRVLALMRDSERTIPGEELEKFHNERIGASEKLLEIAKNDTHKISAYREKLDALMKLNSMDVDGAYSSIKKFCKSLENIEIGELDLQSRAAIHTVNVRRWLRDPKEDALQPTIDAIEQDLDRFKNNENLYPFMANMVKLLFKERRSKVAVKVVETALPYYRESNLPIAKTQIEFFEGLVALEKYAFGQVNSRLVKGAEGSVKDFKICVNKLVEDKAVGDFVYSELVQSLRNLEKTQRYDEAKELNAFLKTRLSEGVKKEVSKYAAEDCDMALKRLALLGKKFDLQGYTLKGKAFDPSRLAGSLHLVIFISSRSQNSFIAMQSLSQQFGSDPNSPIKLVCYIDDDKPYDTIDFIRQRAPHWESASLILVPTAGRGKPNNEFPVKIGIQESPFMVVLNKNTVVTDINVLPAMLKKAIDNANGKKAEPKKEKSGSRRSINGDRQVATIEYQSHRYLSNHIWHEKQDREQEKTDKKGEDKKSDEKENPYLAPKHWSVDDLTDMVLGAEEKPRSIRRRPQFALAISDAADRILSNDKSKKTQKRIAVLGKTEILHEQACLGDSDMDDILAKFIQTDHLADDKRVDAELKFLRLEQNVLATTEIKVDSDEDLKKVKSLIEDSHKFFSKNPKSLTHRHLRLASSTIELVNLLTSEDEDAEKDFAEQREKYFSKMGALFSKGQDKRLVKYGKYLTKSKAASPSALVGKPLELAGETHDGNEFDWKSYREKVVVVDFWATWCGPCRKEMPNVKALYEKMNAKGFEVVGVALDDDTEAVVEYVEQEEIPWQNIVGQKAKELAQKYGVKGIPTMMLVDRKGNVLAVANRVGQFESQIKKQFEK